MQIESSLRIVPMSAGFLLPLPGKDEYQTAVRGVSRIWFGFTKASESNLRTVIVTAAVHRGFSSELRLAPNPSL